MAKNWRTLDLKSKAKNAATQTDEKLASQILALRTFTDDEIKTFFPATADRKKIDELMKIVKSSDDRNRKINRIIENSEKFAGVMARLLAKVV